MIQKRLNCLYCQSEMESKTAKKKFCSDKCKVYYGREMKRGTIVISNVEEPIMNDNATISDPVVIKRKQPAPSLALTGHQIIPPMPQKSDFKDSFEFAAAKNEWKLKYNQ